MKRIPRAKWFYLSKTSIGKNCKKRYLGRKDSLMNVVTHVRKYLSVKFLSSAHPVNIVILAGQPETWMLKEVIKVYEIFWRLR